MPDFISFESGWMLWLLLIPACIVIYSFKQAPYRGRVLRTQAVLLAICLLAAANPLSSIKKQSGQAAIVVDLSESFDEGQARELYNQAKVLTKDLDKVSAITFAGNSRIQSIESAPASYSELTYSKNLLAPGSTDLEQALKDSEALASNIILISDGYQNKGNVFNAIETFNARVFPLVPEKLPEANQQGLQLLSLEHPLMIDSKKSAEIEAGIFNGSDVTKKARINIFDGNKQILSKEIEVEANRGLSLKALSDPELSGIRRIRAELIDQGNKQEKASYISSRSAEKVLLLNGAPEDGSLLSQAFFNRSYDLVSSLTAESLNNLQDFSVIVLNNIANRQLPDGLLSRLPEYVKQGGSLVTIGGNRSFGLGGYIGSLLENLLPVEMLPPKGQEKRLTVAVSLIIDKSRSMADDQKLDFAKEAAREVVRNLKDEDFIGVIGFDSSPFEVVRMGQLGQIRSQAMERIGRLFPAQKTNLFPAMDEGRRRLSSTPAGRKHMIVLTDGKIPDADQSYIELVKEMRLNGITVSTVLVGSEYDFDFLKQLAQKGGGAFYQTSDPSSLPRIFLQDVKVRSGDSSQKEQGSYPVEIGSSGLHSTSIERFPDLLGFVETKPKAKALHELSIGSEKGSFPLLSSWSVEKGKVFAFTSDANGRWSRPWANWNKFANFWTEILDAARGDKQQDNLRYDLRTELEGNQLVLDLATFEETSGPLNISLRDQKGNLKEVSFNKLRKGSYRAKIPVTAESMQYTFSGKAGNRNLTPVSFEIDADRFAEKKGLGFNLKLLNEIANQSSGKINPSPQDLKAAAPDKSVSRSLRNELLIFGLFFYIACIIIREIRDRPLKFR